MEAYVLNLSKVYVNGHLKNLLLEKKDMSIKTKSAYYAESGYGLSFARKVKKSYYCKLGHKKLVANITFLYLR